MTRKPIYAGSVFLGLLLVLGALYAGSQYPSSRVAPQSGQVEGAPATAGSVNRWTLADDGKAGSREEHFLFWSLLLKRALLIGGRTAGDTKSVLAFAPAAKSWEEMSDTKPPETVSSLCAGCIDSEGKVVYFLLGGRLLSFDVGSKSWADLGEEMLLKSVLASGRSLAHDPVNNELITTGPDLKPANIGWQATLAYNIADRKWRRLEFGDEAIRKAHEERKAALKTLEELVGHTRHAWFRSADGTGTEAERTDLADRLAALGKMPGLGDLKSKVAAIAGIVGEKKLLGALKALRALHLDHERATEKAAPVPPARRDSPCCCDPANKVMVLFGGSHDDYVTNDTWILDLTKRQWHRAEPEKAPAPRAGHGMAYLPKSGKIAIFDGYRYNNTVGYRDHQASLLAQREVWLYDVKTNRWDLAASWAEDDKSLPQREGVRNAGFVGYTSSFCAMALAADGADGLIFVGRGQKEQGSDKKNKKYANATWVLASVGQGGSKANPHGDMAPNSRDGRAGIYLASYCEEDAPSNLPDWDKIEANKWTLLPRPARYPFNAQRRCPYGTAIWDPDTEQMLMWGGGHCSSSTTTVTHWSPVTGRIVISYDMDEPLGSNGGGPVGGTVMGRSWVDTHAYRTYAYDAKSKLMVKGGDRLYDPVSMRWLDERLAPLFSDHCYAMNAFATSHGVVAWAPSTGLNGPRGLWLLKSDKKEWRELVKPGQMPGTAVDTSGGCYDPKRDRLILFPATGFQKPVFDKVATYEFKENKAGTLALSNAQMVTGKITNARESVYIPEADWIVMWSQVSGQNAVLDLPNNRWILADFGPVPKEHQSSPAHAGVMYDEKRKMIYAWSNEGSMAVLKVDPKTAKIEGGR